MLTQNGFDEFRAQRPECLLALNFADHRSERAIDTFKSARKVPVKQLRHVAGLDGSLLFVLLSTCLHPAPCCCPNDQIDEKQAKK